MFCPVCKAEYCFGFTKCTDCGVNLVEHLPDGSSALMEPVGDPDAMEVLWAGVRDLTRQSIERALKAAKIEYELDSVGSRLMPASRDDIYRIQVRRGDFRAAKDAIQNGEGGDPIGPRSPAAVQDENSSFLHMLGVNRNLMGRALEDAAPPSESEAAGEPETELRALEMTDGPDSSQSPAPVSLVEDFYPEDATSEVWSGDDEQMGQDIKACLSENGIASVVSNDGGMQRVLVLPVEEARAKEIIREIIEATPPE